jgi:predicted DNA-binding WGR domain protein
MIRLTCTEDGASKFWEGSVAGSELTTRWGKLGTSGQSATKSFASADAADKELAKLVKQKRGKGYVDDGGGAPTKVEPKPAASDRVRLTATTDAGIVLLFDPAHFPSIVDQESWEAALLADEDIAARIAKGHLVPLSTGADGRYAIDVVIGDALGADDAKGVTDTSTPYLLVVAKTAMLGGLEHVYASPDGKWASALSLAPGRYAVTVHAMKGKGRADVLALVRPLADGEAFAGRTKLEIFEEKPKEPLGKITTLKHCQRAALMGRVDEAIPVLTKLADEKKDIAAAAALAEIHAWRGEWPAFVERALVVLANRRAVIGNTTDELAWLLVVAAEHTGDWDRIATGISADSTMVSEKYVRAQVEAKGNAPVVKVDRDERYRNEPLEVRRGYYDRAMDPSVAAKRDKNADGTKKAELMYAFGYGLDELALAKLPAAEKLVSWEQITKLAGWLVDLGRPDDGWALIERSLDRWWPLSHAQIAPMRLLVDERLRPLLTAERRAKILAMPRGNER